MGGNPLVIFFSVDMLGRLCGHDGQVVYLASARKPNLTTITVRGKVPGSCFADVIYDALYSEEED